MEESDLSTRSAVPFGSLGTDLLSHQYKEGVDDDDIYNW